MPADSRVFAGLRENSFDAFCSGTMPFASVAGLRWGPVLSRLLACFRHFYEVSGTTLRKNLKDNILLLLQQQHSNTSITTFGLSEHP